MQNLNIYNILTVKNFNIYSTKLISFYCLIQRISYTSKVSWIINDLEVYITHTQAHTHTHVYIIYIFVCLYISDTMSATFN